MTEIFIWSMEHWWGDIYMEYWWGDIYMEYGALVG
jgi:hypothetical protein